MNNKIKSKMLLISILPLIMIGIICMCITTVSFITYSNKETQSQLTDTVKTLNSVFDYMYPGEYAIKKDSNGARILTKGEYVLNGRIELFDNLKEETGLDYTLFFDNTRVATTIQNKDGFIIGTKLGETIWGSLKSGAEYEYQRVTINNETYNSYYLPLKDEAGLIVGAISVAKPVSVLTDAKIKMLLPISGVIVLMLILSILLVISYAKDITDCIQLIRDFVNNIDNENFNKRLNDKIYQRDDELGEIGRDITVRRNILRDMIEQDGLTELYNKRTGNKRFEAIRTKCKSNKIPYSLAIGDIDFFKKVNDNYGHDAGDIVLKEIASLIKKKMKGQGFVARWGGEEFMLGFENKNKEKAKKVLDAIVTEIRNTTIDYNGTVIDVTMTFGLVAGNEAKTAEELFKIADNRLYIGKNNGRNQIVCEGQ